MARKRTQLEMDGIQRGFVHLDGKASARMSYSFLPSSTPTAKHSQQLLVFLGGIDAPQSSWQGALTKLASLSKENGFPLPPILLYDRFGVGESDHDPQDIGRPDAEYHDAVESMRDLRQLIMKISLEKLGLTETKAHDLRIVFCAHSIGCCIGRFYADAYPGTVEALLLIESAIAGTAAEKLVPNPDIPEEWEKGKWMLPEGTSADLCRRAVLTAKHSPFSGHPKTIKERLRWNNMPGLLPSSRHPLLRGPRPYLPLVTVLISDAEVSIPQLAKGLKLPEPLLENTWGRLCLEYSEGLVHLQGQGVGKGPVTAKGCGHDIPRDGPGIVASELADLLLTLSNTDRSRI